MISIIVPIYNVEPYLETCIRSLTEQTCTDLEILLVDDGSTDGCAAICDAWAAKDHRIRVIHKDHGGPSDARNAGLAIAQGDFIGFVDSDDYIAPTMYQELMDRLTETGSDIAVCGARMVWENGKTAMLTCPGSAVLDNTAAMKSIITEDWLKQTVWNRLYRRFTVENIPFETGKLHEDVYWSYQAIARAAQVCVFDTPLYFYRQRNASIMGVSYSLRRLDAVRAKVQRQEFLEWHYPVLASLGRTNLLFFCLYNGQMALNRLTGSAQKEALSMVRSAYRNCPLPDRAYLNTLPFTHRCWLSLGKVSFRLTCRLRNLAGVGL